MTFKASLHSLVDGNDLSEDEMLSAMTQIMEGEVADSQLAAFLTALHIKGETVPEIVGAAKVMRAKAEKLDIKSTHLVDTCGTGGDGADTFNISTASALVSAGAGVIVAKHGNRAVSSRSGSADVLKCLGVNLDANLIVVKRCVDEAGIGFLFAPLMHKAMKHAAGVRKELGFRTVFNLLGPLTNPANAQAQVLGVFDVKWVQPLAEVLRDLGCLHALVVHGSDGLDEITLTGESQVAELKNGEVTSYSLDPKKFGFNYCDSDDLKGGTPEENATTIQKILDGEKGPRRDIVLINSAAAIYVAGKADSLERGIQLATNSIESGKAREKLEDLCRITHA
ncbi:MAG: anthranilate phosphoribosyltransferase [Nitrospina sp.]|jgi:anthranilate phosphoribosyltransferase|nr:anthranilate phosphoribosyltransferase [Nitrospina sp.]MBT3509647.1 anthranilate phosphoribosyltransferase [Nitrospina sp.]MBT3875519.1 anthranilate phosphoribosyltransferase [Nitrospina sp.]MBT4047682.1 anthranilate phosphoribosyltransferase [Nitrospina sp.]MBT5350061.1 anthranilate phosphoribosyltransferase [Nitrospina sp.]